MSEETGTHLSGGCSAGQFDTANSEGFEVMGSAGAETFFQVLPLPERRADKRAVNPWKWHLAEIRAPAGLLRLVQGTYGGGLFRGAFYRCYGFVYAYFHLTRCMNQIADYMIGQNRESMTAEQVGKSEARLKIDRRNLLKNMSGRRLPCYRLSTTQIR